MKTHTSLIHVIRKNRKMLLGTALLSASVVFVTSYTSSTWMTKASLLNEPGSVTMPEGAKDAIVQRWVVEASDIDEGIYTPATGRLQVMINDTRYEGTLMEVDVGGGDMEYMVDLRLWSDLDEGGDVDFQDFIGYIQVNFGMTSGATHAQGDLNSDGKVNFQDFIVLQVDFGMAMLEERGDDAGAAPSTVELLSPLVSQSRDYTLLYRVDGTDYSESIMLSDPENVITRTVTRANGRSDDVTWVIRYQPPYVDVATKEVNDTRIDWSTGPAQQLSFPSFTADPMQGNYYSKIHDFLSMWRDQPYEGNFEILPFVLVPGTPIEKTVEDLSYTVSFRLPTQQHCSNNDVPPIINTGDTRMSFTFDSSHQLMWARMLFWWDGLCRVTECSLHPEDIFCTPGLNDFSYDYKYFRNPSDSTYIRGAHRVDCDYPESHRDARCHVFPAGMKFYSTDLTELSSIGNAGGSNHYYEGDDHLGNHVTAERSADLFFSPSHVPNLDDVPAIEAFNPVTYSNASTTKTEEYGSFGVSEMTAHDTQSSALLEKKILKGTRVVLHAYSSVDGDGIQTLTRDYYAIDGTTMLKQEVLKDFDSDGDFTLVNRKEWMPGQPPVEYRWNYAQGGQVSYMKFTDGAIGLMVKYSTQAEFDSGSWNDIWEYHANGEVKRVVVRNVNDAGDMTVRLRREYDDSGRLVRELLYDADNAWKVTKHATYNYFTNGIYNYHSYEELHPTTGLPTLYEFYMWYTPFRRKLTTRKVFDGISPAWHHLHIYTWSGDFTPLVNHRHYFRDPPYSENDMQLPTPPLHAFPQGT